MNPATKTLLWLLSVCLATIVIIIFIKPIPLESFFGTPTSTSIRFTQCPTGTTTYITSHGDTHCCNGEIKKGKCIGVNMCSLSPKYPESTVQTCSEIIQYLWYERSRDWCPPSAPNFYGTMNRYSNGIFNEWGCSSSVSNSMGGKPTDTPATFCTIYETEEENLSKTATTENPEIISCRNMRDADTAKTFITGSTALWEPQNSYPALIKLSFTPLMNGTTTNGTTAPVTCYEFNRFITFYRKMFPSYIDFIRTQRYNNVYFCDAAKGYYITGTLSASNAMGIPRAGQPNMPGMCS
jgi:hypothetical protein